MKIHLAPHSRQPKAFGPKRHPVQLYALLTQILFGGSSTFRPNKGETLGFDDAKLDNQGPVARSMVSVNQRLIPWQRIGFETA